MSNMPYDEGNFLIRGSTPYMQCPDGDPTCITQNSTHVCYHGVQDVVRVFNHFFLVTSVSCTDQRIYGTTDNITYGYVDPDVSSFPPSSFGTPSNYDYMGFFNMSADAYGLLTPGSAVVTGGSVPTTMEDPEYGYFHGYYTLTNEITNTWKLTGTFVFVVKNQTSCFNETVCPGCADAVIVTTCSNYTCGLYTCETCVNTTDCSACPPETAENCQTKEIYVEGNDYFLSLQTGESFQNCSLPGLVVNNITGELIYNPITDNHPNPRFNDPQECYILEVSVMATIPMVKSPAPAPRRYKDFWMQGVGPSTNGTNEVPALQACAAIFLRKVLYVGSSEWLSGDSTDFPTGSEDGDLRYVCLRSLEMPATCSRFGAPMKASDYDTLLDTINPPNAEMHFLL
jgi:hypothetical protein